jgi:hypothetical protein
MKRPFLPVIAAVAATAWALALFLCLIDPLDIYGWGMEPKLRTDGDYSMQATAFLAGVVAKDSGIDTVFIGGSTGHFFTAQMMEDALPDTHRAFNLSYSSPSATDRAAVARQVLRFSHAHRYIIEADWTYTIPMAEQHMAESFPIYLYDDVWWNDVRGINWQTLALSMALLRGDGLWISAWSKTREQDGYRNRYGKTHTPAALADLREMVAHQRARVDTPSTLKCETLDEAVNHLIPFARALAARGAEVDVLMPLYSSVMYYWAAASKTRQQLSRATLLNDELLLRRCLVEALDGLAGIRIFAFDDVAGLAGDYSNYFDPGHLYNPAANLHLLQSIARGEHRLTRGNIDAANEVMTRNVVRYEFANDKPWAAQP